MPNLGPSGNLALGQDALVVRRHPETGARRLDALCWGLVPHFTKYLKAARKPINPRAETVASKLPEASMSQVSKALAALD